MSMLSYECVRLRENAKLLVEFADSLVSGPMLLSDTKDAMSTTMRISADHMREAADTIEGLRDRLHESCEQVPEQEKRDDDGERESYDAGFENGVKACLQQLDGLIHEGANVDEIQAWVDRQWEEETV